jgi:hypothetical protein
MLKTCKIHTILIESETAKESSHEGIIPENKLAEMEEMERKVETEYIKKTISIHPLSNAEIAEMAIAYSEPQTKTKYDANSLANAKFIKEIKGSPAELINRFAAGKIQEGNIELRLVPYYSVYICVDKRYLNKFSSNKLWIQQDHCDSDDVSISRHSIYFRTETFKSAAILKKTSQEYFTFNFLDAFRVVSDKTMHNEDNEQNAHLSDAYSDVNTDLLDAYYHPSEDEISAGEQQQEIGSFSSQNSFRNQKKDGVEMIVFTTPGGENTHHTDMLPLQRRKSQKSSKQGSPKDISFLRPHDSLKVNGSPIIRSRESLQAGTGLFYSPIIFTSPQDRLQNKPSPSIHRQRLQESMTMKTINIGGITLNMATRKMNP